MKSDIFQASALGPTVFKIYRYDNPTTKPLLALFADETASITQNKINKKYTRLY